MTKSLRSAIAFIRSMSFGYILLISIAACSVAGSLVPQGREAAYYAEAYPSFGRIIAALGLDRIFSSHVFLALVALLCINLVACSISRFRGMARMVSDATSHAFAAEARRPIDPAERQTVERYLASRRYAQVSKDGAAVYSKNTIGHYGSFILHLSILAIVAFAALAAVTATVNDYTIMTGQAMALADGTVITVDGFKARDEEGHVDFVSAVRVDGGNGSSIGPVDIRVNEPLSFDGKKYFQQSYGQAGSLVIKNRDSGESDILTLTESSVFTVSPELELVYLGMHKGADSQAQAGYRISTRRGGESTLSMIAPGATVALGAIDFVFGEPIAYTTLRVKATPPGAMALLYASFAAMILGLWLCFFTVPVYICVRDDAIAFAEKNGAHCMRLLDTLLPQANEEHP